MEDILIHSEDLDTHKQLLTQVLQLLNQYGLKAKRTKCTFGQQKISYLGHIISKDGVSTNLEKVSTIEQWPTPMSVKEVRSFLGLAGYYRKFIRHFGIITKPMTNLLRKGTVFIWTSIKDTTFQMLKQALVTAPVLALPKFCWGTQ